MRFIRLVLASAMLLSAAPLKAEDAYPSRQVSVIVPFAAGGSADIFARMVANHLQAKLGKPFVVENVGGAGSIVGVTRLARSAPDGLTLGLASTSALAINPSRLSTRQGFAADHADQRRAQRTGRQPRQDQGADRAGPDCVPEGQPGQGLVRLGRCWHLAAS